MEHGEEKKETKELKCSCLFPLKQQEVSWQGVKRNGELSDKWYHHPGCQALESETLYPDAASSSMFSIRKILADRYDYCRPVVASPTVYSQERFCRVAVYEDDDKKDDKKDQKKDQKDKKTIYGDRSQVEREAWESHEDHVPFAGFNEQEYLTLVACQRWKIDLVFDEMMVVRDEDIAQPWDFPEFDHF